MKKFQNKKLRVIQVITLSEWSGALQVVYDIVRNLNKEIFRMVLFASLMVILANSFVIDTLHWHHFG